MGFHGLTPLERRQFLSVSAHIRVLNNETMIQAGQSVHVSALGTAKANGTKFGHGDATAARIQWDFHDSNGAFNRLPGFNAGHVYETPGKYKVTLKVTNAAGEVGTASKWIKVLPAKRKAIYVNPWGSDKNDGSTPDKAVATVARAGQLIGDDTAVYFRSGMKFPVKKGLQLPFSNVVIGAYGRGEAPKLQIKSNNARDYASIFDTTDSSHQIKIENLALENIGSTAAGEIIHVNGSNITIKGCTFKNVDSAIMDGESPAGVLAFNNTASTLRSYFAFVRGTDQAFLGNIAGDSTKQHNIRIYGSRILAYGNDLTNLAKGTSLATLRVNNGSNVYWSNNVLHGGQMYVGPLGHESAGANADERVDQVVIENNRWEEVPKHWSANVRLQISAGVANVMVRNNIIEATNSVAFNANTYMQEKFKTGMIDRSIENLQVLSNTVVNHGTSGAFINVGGGQQGVITLKNSLYVAPDLDIGMHAAAAVRVNARDDLLNFTTLSSGGGIDGNVWNLPSGAKSLGVNYVASKAAGPAAYRTPNEWLNQFPDIVGNDSFEKILSRDLTALGMPPKDSIAAKAAEPVSGVFSDLVGNTRPADTTWTAGALQLI